MGVGQVTSRNLSNPETSDDSMWSLVVDALANWLQILDPDPIETCTLFFCNKTLHSECTNERFQHEYRNGSNVLVFSCLWQCWRLVRSFWAYATKQCCQNTYIVVDKFCGVGLPLTDNEPMICNQVLSYPQPVQQFNPSCSKCFHQTWHQWWLCALNIINHLFGNKRCQFRIHFHHHPNFSKVILKSYFIGLQCTPRASKTQEFVAVFFQKHVFSCNVLQKPGSWQKGPVSSNQNLYKAHIWKDFGSWFKTSCFFTGSMPGIDIFCTKCSCRKTRETAIPEAKCHPSFGNSWDFEKFKAGVIKKKLMIFAPGKVL